jgi:hypothetical protein
LKAFSARNFEITSVEQGVGFDEPGIYLCVGAPSLREAFNAPFGISVRGASRMGFSATWCAVREEGAQKLLAHLSLSPTGATEKLPASLMSTAKLDTGWRVIWYNQYGCPFLQPKDLGDISHAQDVLMCLVEEHVMASSAEYWSGGKRQWWIAHRGDDGPRGLATDGDLPECFAAIRRDMEEAQRAAGGEGADVDYLFDVPLKVAQTLVGFKHDEACPHLLAERFVVLSRAAPQKGVFRRLFGT